MASLHYQRVFGMAALVCWIICHPWPVAGQVDQQLAQVYFKEARALCGRDSGHLWGVPICAPMIIADRRTPRRVKGKASSALLSMRPGLPTAAAGRGRARAPE